ncbi:hypothetical protein A2954_04390 [Candidatus Roizmanbacteria bacterium RIFCSPLOWO2_01_FULL_37_12]|uniref:DOT1 domain-containing protein n=1 Tax=Candidatus Roizmanbacteria bacterium RIFCSPLOWO2_01_FULL_37_12 TaxID=1802056 RepID=A0A1F7IFU6_9BACT|nr:MAG: hypothetical protein A3D76_06300 [Candidatus Roizmanbacteria bacterium RIFCSPHIGHO2_02_FULL_37_9b]OGK42222.1 MAG: hypothetical protein A2954_04390 [Candidatus Roizmanbacteria bacterium RIFCSPLOWO2_01_FULL_37_12]
MIFVFFLFILLFAIILIFSSKKFSPIPYFPSNKKDLDLILRALNLKKNQIIFDLGAGDGLVIFAAAKKSHQKKLDTKFIAVEINPILLLILNMRRFFHPNKKNIKIIRGDIFKMNYNQLTSKQANQATFYLYISPWYLEKTLSNIKKQIKKFSIVSYMYPIKSLKKKERIVNGLNSIYIY